MNWYKTAQVPIKDVREHSEEYFDIGHKSYWKEEEFETDELENKHYKQFKEKTWIWIKGVLYICDGDVDHELCIRQNIGMIENMDFDQLHEFMYTIYKGRFGYYKGEGKKVSLIVPAGREFNRIPTALIRDLEDTFGSDITIYRFN